MSEREFDAYLKLLSGLLRLAPSQREQIAGELRDHMEERLDALLAAGVSREEAIGQALEEFGDVAALAASFRQIAWNRKRRWIMRWTAASVCGVLLVIVAAMTFWPNTPAGPGVLASASAQDQEAGTQPNMKTPEQRNAETRAKLEQESSAIFPGVSLSLVLQQYQDAHELSIYVDEHEIEINGVDLDTEIVEMNMSDVRCSMALDLILERFDCGYYLRDGFVIVTSKDKALSMAELHVYECAEVLSSVPVDAAAMLHRTGGGGLGADIDNGSQSPGGAARAKQGDRPYIFTSSNADTLIEIITRTVDPDSWEMNGGWGSIAEYDGKLVVRQTEAAHAQIKYLLDSLGPEYAVGANSANSAQSFGGDSYGNK